MEEDGGAPSSPCGVPATGGVEKAVAYQSEDMLGGEANIGCNTAHGVPDVQISPPSAGISPSPPSSGTPPLLGQAAGLDVVEANRSGDEADAAFSATRRPDSPASFMEGEDPDTPRSPTQQTTSPQPPLSPQPSLSPPLVSEVVDALYPESPRPGSGALTRGMCLSAGGPVSSGPPLSSTPPSPASSRSSSSPGGARVSSPVSAAPLVPTFPVPFAPERRAEPGRCRIREGQASSSRVDRYGDSVPAEKAGRGSPSFLERNAFDRETNSGPTGIGGHSPFFSPLQGAGVSSSAGGSGGSNRPQHPLVHASTPSWVKYGEEHYPEEAVPIEYQWVEDDGTCCCYVTDFLLYNKKGERLLQVETLDQDELADVALYGKLVHVALVHPPEALEARKHPTACQVYPHLQQRKRHQNSSRGRKHLQTPEDEPASQQVSPRAGSALPRDGDKEDRQARDGDNAWRADGDSAVRSQPREDGEKKEEKLLVEGEKETASGAATPSLGSRKVLRKRGGMLHHPYITPKIPRPFRTFPVRVDLTEWMIDYGKSASQTPYVWLVSSLNRYYRLEKPAGRYAPVLQSLKYKFEVASRVIKQLSVNHLYPYQELVDHLTADSRLKALAKKGAGKDGEGPSGCASAGGDIGESGDTGLRASEASGLGGEPGRDEASEEKAGDDAEEEDEKDEADCSLGKGAGSQPASAGKSRLGEGEEGLTYTERLKDDLSRPSSIAGDDDEDRAGVDLASGLAASSPSNRVAGDAHASAASSILGTDFGNLVLPPGLGSPSSSLPLDPSSLFTSSKFISALAIKKNKNCHLLSLSDPDGTGVRVLPDGSRSPESPWGAALAVEGCTEESLIEVFPFLEAQVAAFEAATGTTGLLSSPFMNTLRARVFRWVGKLDDDNRVEEVPPLQQTTTPEIVGGRTDEGGLLSHQSEDVLLSLNEFASSCAAERPPLSGSTAFARGGPGDRGQPGPAFDSPAFGDGAGFFGPLMGPRGGRRRGARGSRGARGEGGRGRGRGRGGRDAAFARLLGDDRDDFFAGDEDARVRMEFEKSDRLKREGDAVDGEDDEPLTNKTGDGCLEDTLGLSDDEDGRKRIKREEGGTSQGGPWGGKGDDAQRKAEEEEEEDELSTLPEWGIEGDPVDVKDELDLEAEDPVYARVPLPGTSFTPYDFPELLEVQDFCRVFIEMLQLPSYPVDTLEAALLVAASSTVSQDFSTRAAWPAQAKGTSGLGAVKNGRKKRNPAIPQNPLPFIAASTCLAPSPEPFQFLFPLAAKREDAASGLRQPGAIRTGAALRDAAAVALANAAKAEESRSAAGHPGQLALAEKAEEGEQNVRPEAKREEGSADLGDSAATERDFAKGPEDESQREGERRDDTQEGGESDLPAVSQGDGAAAAAAKCLSRPPEEGPASWSAGSVEPAALLPSSGTHAPRSRSPFCGPPLLSGSARLHASSFPVFVSDALFLRLLQLAFLHISDALARHNKTASSGDAVNPDARSPLPSLLTGAGAASAGIVTPGGGPGVSGVPGTVGGAETPVAATWLGSARADEAWDLGDPSTGDKSKDSGSALFGEEGGSRATRSQGEEEGVGSSRSSVASLWVHPGGPGFMNSEGKAGGGRASKAAVGVAMKQFWRHAALGSRLRRLVPRPADEEEEERDEKRKGVEEQDGERESGEKARKAGRRKEAGAEGDAPEAETDDVTTEEEGQGRETGRDGRARRPRQTTPGAAGSDETNNEAEVEPKVLHMLSSAPLDLRMIDFLTWPLVLQRMLFDCLYSPRRVAVKKPRRRSTRSEDEAREPEKPLEEAALREDNSLECTMKEGEDEDESLTTAKEEEKDGEEAGPPESKESQKACEGKADSGPSAEETGQSEVGEESRGKHEAAVSSLSSSGAFQGCTPSPVNSQASKAEGERGKQDVSQKDEREHDGERASAGGPEEGACESGRGDREEKEDAGDEGDGQMSAECRPVTEETKGDGEDSPDPGRGTREEDSGETATASKATDEQEAEMEEQGDEKENGVLLDEDAEQNVEDRRDDDVESFQEEGKKTSRSRETKRKRTADEDQYEEERGEKDASQKGESDETSLPADGNELKASSSRKKTRRTSNDVELGDEEGDTVSKGRSGEEDDEEEAEEEEVERLEWHLDDQKAAQCGILPSRAEAMAIAFHEMRSHSTTDVTRRLQLLQWLIACIANGWMGKFFLDAKVEALFRARANTLRLRMASMGTGPIGSSLAAGACRGQAGAGSASGAKAEGADGDSGLASSEAPVPPPSTNTEDSAAVDGSERPEDSSLPVSASDTGETCVPCQSPLSGDAAGPAASGTEGASSPSEPAALSGAGRGRRAGDGEEKRSGRGNGADGDSTLGPGGKKKRGGASAGCGVGVKGTEEEDCVSMSEGASKAASNSAEGFEAEDEMGRAGAEGVCGASGPGGENALNPGGRGVGRGKKPMGRVSNWEMELLAQKFPIRGEILGEDRFLNRYFLVPTARGVPRVFVEAFSQSRIDPVDAINGFLDHMTAAAVETEERRKDEKEEEGASALGLPPGTPTSLPVRSGAADSGALSSGSPPAGLEEASNPAACGQGGPLAGDRVAEVGRRSSRRIAQMKEEQRQQELQDSLSSFSPATNGCRSDDRKRKRASLSEGKRCGFGGSLLRPSAALKDGSVNGEKTKFLRPEETRKHWNDFVRRAVGFESISTYLHYLDETLKACSLFVVPPGKPLQQLQHALSPFLVRERALKEKLRRVDQQFQQLAAATPLPTPVPTFVPPSPFAAAIWHGCRLLLQIEEALLLPLFSSSWGFASMFQKQQHILRLLDQTRDKASPSLSASRGRGESRRGGGAGSEDEGEKEKEEKPERSSKEEEDAATQKERELLRQLQSRVWPQDMLHKCLSTLAAHANVMDGARQGGEKREDGTNKMKPDAKAEERTKTMKEEKPSRLPTADDATDGDPAGRACQIQDPEAEEREREERREEEKEAQWMERRICLGVFVQLLLYVEDRIHMQSNVHTAAWHLQQHEQWRRELTALGGASLLAQLALPLPSVDVSSTALAGDSENREDIGRERGDKNDRERRSDEDSTLASPTGCRRRILSEDDATAGEEDGEETGEGKADKGSFGPQSAKGEDTEEDREKPSLDWQSRDGDEDGDRERERHQSEREMESEKAGDASGGRVSPSSTSSKNAPTLPPSPLVSTAVDPECAAPVSVPETHSVLSPNSPLRRVRDLIETIGWDCDRVFNFLRELRIRELDEMKRARDLEGRTPHKGLLDRELFEGVTLQGAATFEGEEDPVLSWTEVRNRHDVLAIWGCYLNLWKAHGVDKQKAVDARTAVDRNTFLSLLAHDEQKAQLPEVGSRLFYFRKGHEQMMKSMQQEYVETTGGKSWLDSTSLPLSIPFELGRVEELIVESISYHPGIISPLPRAPSPASLSSLLSGLPGSEAEASSLLPEKLYSFSIVDDPYALGLLVGDAFRQKARHGPSQPGGAKREASGPTGAGTTPASTPGVPSFAGASAPSTADLLLSSRPSSADGNAEGDCLAVPGNTLAASTPGPASSVVRSPGVEHNSAAGERGEMDGSATPSDPFLSEKTLPAGVVGKSEFELLCAADPLAVAAQEAARGKHLLLQYLAGKNRDEGDGGETETKVPVETAPYYRMVCRVLRRSHETTADNITDRVKSIVAAAAAANEEKPHTRTSSRLLSYQNRSLSSRSGSRSGASGERRGGSSGGRKGQGGSGDDSLQGSEGAFFQSPHVSGPQGEREVVLCVPMRADDVEFVVRREKVFHALNLNWNPGMRFRMVFHTTVPAPVEAAPACGKEKDGAGASGAAGRDGGAGAGGGAGSAGSPNSTGSSAGGSNAGGGGAGLGEKGNAGSGERPSFVSTTTRYTGTIRRVDLLHPDFWENVVVEWEDRSRTGVGACTAGSSSRGTGAGIDRGATERGSGQKHSDADAGLENVSLWELEPLKRLKRPGGNAGD
ncbi:hypothetical protein TGGT1_228120 [Toxoplasma gondii GT1]|uniref:RFTS domain-containing protein n=1 Tax=Toxoplasma gondii (strain ATCC 50853 / GT1) TaxID=507601 RepID=S7UWZ2_TOXGG|nr:hypothetical protein TGGT1_228120 [Toxoplasma gondii GT1]